MKPIEFAEQTTTFAKDQPEYSPLPAHVFQDRNNQGRVAFCWSLSWRERIALLWTGVVWQEVLTFGQPLQPQLLSVEKPVMILGAGGEK